MSEYRHLLTPEVRERLEASEAQAVGIEREKLQERRERCSVRQMEVNAGKRAGRAL